MKTQILLLLIQSLAGVDRTERVTPVGDAEALAAAMAESLSATHIPEALKARAQDFSIEKSLDEYESLLFPVAKRAIL